MNNSWETTTYSGLPAWTSVKNTFLDIPGERSLSFDDFVPMCKSCPTSGVMTLFASRAPGSCAIPEEMSEEGSTTDGSRTPPEATSDGSRTPPEEAEEESWEKASSGEIQDSWENVSYGGLPVWTSVKNTFIDCPVDRSESLDAFLRLHEPQCKSCPTSGVMMGHSTTTEESSSLPEESAAEDSSTDNCTWPVTWADIEDEHEEVEEPVMQLNLSTMLAIDSSKPVFSVGSQAHEFGMCRPCGFVHKPEGCTKGASCPYCHVCPPGTIKAMKQAKQSMIKAKKAEYRMQRQQMRRMY